jgi:hypothetical protein
MAWIDRKGCKTEQIYGAFKLPFYLLRAAESEPERNASVQLKAHGHFKAHGQIL